MITAITLLRRKPGLTTREFQSYWKTRHAAVIETLPGIDRYTQSHPLHDQPEDAEPAWDGIAELWAKDSQSFRDIGASDAYRLVLKDEENFLDRDATALVLTDVLLRREGQAAADGVKYVRFLKRRPGFAPEDFQAYWRDTYGPLVDALPGLGRYVQYHARLGGYKGGREPAFDGVDATWFADVAGLRTAFVSAAAGRMRSAEAAFLAPGDPTGIATREFLLIG